ncbi:putative GTP cyclohydrolase-2 [Penicillium oxalicum]|uniref:putative GTP cyclohydrolase-2 n=1 Tax=Penicillium oxalicum TaxID=69781 RepID=UPI0020B6B169|nr:putative GTP cyclohydrolase-2 [Penicillium oxalicum]KAI2790788.1 putative GTP cyclohydrolase-2 [Penicillium oxalicum]
MTDLPAHASPKLTPQSSSVTDRHEDLADDASQGSGIATGEQTPALPNSILSPAFTPPATPGGTLHLTSNPTHLLHENQSASIRHQGEHKKAPKLLEQLPHVECIVRARIPTTNGAEMFLHLYHNDIDNKEHLAIVFGSNIRSRSLDRVRPGETEMDRMIRGAYVGKLHPGRTSSWYDDEKNSESAQAGRMEPPLVRIHSECYTGETAWSARCDCGEQLDEAARLMSFPVETLAADAPPETQSLRSRSAGGVIIYLRQEGRGIGLGEKLKAYNLQDLGSDTVEANLLLRHPADARSYGLATAMLQDLGCGADVNPDGIRLLTNNPDKVRAIEGPNREVLVKERVPMIPLAWRTGGERGIKSSEIEGYLRTKELRLWGRPLDGYGDTRNSGGWLTRVQSQFEQISKMGHMIQ